MTKSNNSITEFDKGVWLAVEFLVLSVDQPSFAKEIIQQVPISLEKAVALAKLTNFQPHKTINTLIYEKTWTVKNTISKGVK